MVAGAHIPYEPVKDEEDAIDHDANLGWRSEESPHAATTAWGKRAGMLAASCLAVAGLVKTNQLPAGGLFHGSAVKSSAEHAKVRAPSFFFVCFMEVWTEENNPHAPSSALKTAYRRCLLRWQIRCHYLIKVVPRILEIAPMLFLTHPLFPSLGCFYFIHRALWPRLLLR